MLEIYPHQCSPGAKASWCHITTDLQDSVDGGGGGAVEGGECDTVVAAVLEQLDHVVASENAGGDNTVETHGVPGEVDEELTVDHLGEGRGGLGRV